MNLVEASRYVGISITFTCTCGEKHTLEVKHNVAPEKMECPCGKWYQLVGTAVWEVEPPKEKKEKSSEEEGEDGEGEPEGHED
jgi:hypothetical protein